MGMLQKMGLASTLVLAWSVTPAVGARAADVPEVGVPAELPGPGPYTFPTAEQPGITVEIIAQGLEHLYSIAFLPGGDALIVERGMRLRLLRRATLGSPELVEQPIGHVPQYSAVENLSPLDVLGIQDVKPDPDFASNGLVYFTYNRPSGFDPAAGRITASTVLARARLADLQLVEIVDLLVGEPMVGTGGSRILITDDRQLFVSIGAPSEGDVLAGQRTDNVYGKVLRIGLDGSVPADNPFVGRPGARPEIWTYGHRDPLGLAVDPVSGRLISSEHGPQGGDELNELLPGRNYGWPNYTYGTEYAGSRLPAAPVAGGTQGPMLIWSPGIAPNGIAFSTGRALPGWSNNLFVTSARRGQINGTGALIRVVFNDRLEELRQEVLLDDLHQRFKDVRQGPDGLLYAVTDEASAVVVRIGPSAAFTSGSAD
ncbi:MAG: PQQ-dependent sugar dehydrogenase [Alteraurantiacibacter sp.]